MNPTAGPARGEPAGVGRFEARYTDGTYRETVPNWHLSDAPWKAAAVSRMIERHGLRPRRVVDVGCGAGGILRELRSRLPAEVELEGYDISPDAIALCREHGGERLRYVQADFTADGAAHADLALVLDVFEHVPDYLGFLAALRGKADWFIFHVPIDLSMQGLRHDSAWPLAMRSRYGHLHYFTKQTALATLADVGYEIVDCFYTDDQKTWNPGDLSLKARVLFEVRRALSRRKPDLAAQLFEGFSVLILARRGS
jgi:SAM-dependent methyltransferase